MLCILIGGIDDNTVCHDYIGILLKSATVDTAQMKLPGPDLLALDANGARGRVYRPQLATMETFEGPLTLLSRRGMVVL